MLGQLLACAEADVHKREKASAEKASSAPGGLSILIILVWNERDKK